MNRASSLGYFVPELDGCLRRGVYERTNWGDKKMFEVATILIFEEGDRQENAVFRDLLDAGFPIIEQQTPFAWKDDKNEVILTGHIDGKVMCEAGDHGERVAVPVEIKSMHPNIFATVHTLEDFKKKPWTKAYIAQITVYMLMNNIDTGLFLLKNKSSGQMKQIQVYLDYELGEACIRTAEKINECVKKQELPDRINDRDTCKGCPFNHICLPDMDFGQEIEVGDDPSFEEKIDKYLEIKHIGKEAEKLWKEILSPRMKASAKDGFLNMLLGKYHLKGKTDKKGSFRGKIELIGEGD